MNLFGNYIKLKTEAVKEMKLTPEQVGILDTYLKYAVTLGYEKSLEDVAGNIDMLEYRNFADSE